MLPENTCQASSVVSRVDFYLRCRCLDFPENRTCHLKEGSYVQSCHYCLGSRVIKGTVACIQPTVVGPRTFASRINKWAHFELGAQLTFHVRDEMDTTVSDDQKPNPRTRRSQSSLVTTMLAYYLSQAQIPNRSRK